jgi:small-conductance mechanosensitive channel
VGRLLRAAVACLALVLVAPAARAVGPAGSASAAPPASASAIPPVAAAPAEVKLRDRVVFVIRGPWQGKPAADRAREATQAVVQAADEGKPDEVRVERGTDTVVVYVGQIPIVQLGPEDARSAGDGSTEVHAEAVAAKLREALRAEQQCSRVTQTVLSLALVVFLGLVALYAVRKLGELARRGARYLEEHPDRVPAIHVRTIEVVRPHVLRSGVLVSVALGKWLGQATVVYAWLVFSLWLFAPTRGYTERLTGFVLSPLSALAGRLANALPVLLVAALAGIAVLVVLRFVGLFFDGVARGDTDLAWLTPELAPATSLLVRAGVVVAALFFAAPVVTGDPEGGLARMGGAVLVTLGLATTPLLASGVVGTLTVFGRSLPIGRCAEIGGRVGRIISVGLLEVRLVDGDGREVRVPHLVTLWHPTRLLGPAPEVTASVSVAAGSNAVQAAEVLAAAAGRYGEDARVEVDGIDSDGVHFRVTVASAAPGTRSALLLSLATALADAKLPLGRVPHPPGSA